MGSNTMAEKQGTSDWKKLYDNVNPEELPWFSENLDNDLEYILRKTNIVKGDVLDIGTGPGTQAIELAGRGFEVTATDISDSAIQKAKERAALEKRVVKFIPDDILETKLTDNFDFVFDRGCFHVLPPDRRKDYVKATQELLKPSGWLFLKCFSQLEPGDYGPYRLSPEEIRNVFQSPFIVHSIKDTVFIGNQQPPPKALFCVIQKGS